MIIKVKTLVFCKKKYEYGDVHVMYLPRQGVQRISFMKKCKNLTSMCSRTGWVVSYMVRDPEDK